MRTNELTLEKALYLLAFILAFALRVWQLGWLPLSDQEAQLALQALAVTRGEAIVPVAHAAYLALTGGLFYLFGDSDVLARLATALAGSMIVLWPFLMRPYFGRLAGLALAFGLALDPGMVAISRQAGGPMLALTAGLLCAGLFFTRRPVWAGIAGGLALLAGPAAVQGVLIAGITSLVWVWLQRAGRFSPWLASQDVAAPEVPLEGTEWRRMALAGLVTILLAGTLFFRFPAGLAAWWQAIPGYLQGWTEPGNIPSVRLVAALIIYQPLAFLFALISLGQAVVWRDGFVERVAVWMGGALLVVLVYPARQVGDLVWILVPAWVLAAYTLQELWRPFPGQRWIALVQAVLIYVLLTLLWLNLISFDQPLPNAQAALLRLGFVVGVLALAALTIMLVGLGWSWAAAWRGAGWGLVLGLGLYVVANVWSAAEMRPRATQDLWTSTPRTGQAELLLATAGDLSEWNTGLRDAIDIVMAVDSPALHWVLRDFTNLHIVPARQSLNFRELPSIILASPQQDSPNLAASYRGQDFAWRIMPGWNGILPDDTLHWLLFREAPEQSEWVILWARSDLFPGGTLSQEQPAEPPLEIDPLEEGR